MTSKISFFNKSLMRRDLARCAPLLGAFFAVWLLLLPVSLYSGYTHVSPSENLADNLLRTFCTVNLLGCTASVFLTGMAAAWFSFHDYFSARSTNFYAALPIRRETQFLSHYLNGLLIYFVPLFIIYLLSALFCAAVKVPLYLTAAEFFAAHMLAYLFFYNFSVFCCMMISNAVAMPILYLVLNFAIPVLTVIIASIVQLFTYGMPEPLLRSVMDYSPMLKLCTDGISQYNFGTPGNLSAHVSSWGYLLTIAGIGIVMAALSFLLFRSRRMECSGDVIAAPWLRPIFRYAFTFGCSFVIGMIVLMSITQGEYRSVSAFAACIALLIGAFIGNFSSLMMLKKTIRVFKRGWVGLIVCGVLLIVFVGGLQLDIFGYEKNVPDAAEVSSVQVIANSTLDRSTSLNDPEIIEKAVLLHQRFLNEKQSLTEMSRASDAPYYMSGIDFRYRMKDGRELSRSYRYPSFYDQKDADPNGITQELTDLLNEPKVILANCAPAWELKPEQFTYCFVSISSDEYADVDCRNQTLGNQEAYTLFTECILPDLADSSLGMTNRPSEVEFDGSVYLEFIICDKAADEHFYSYTVSRDAKRTVAYLNNNLTLQ